MSDDLINKLKLEKDFLRETLNAHIVDLCALTDMLQRERDEARAEVDLKGSRLDDALDEIERLRDAALHLKQALMVTSNVWGRHHTTKEDAKYHQMVDAAIDLHNLGDRRG